MRELTVRGLLLGGLITLLFTAANVYLGLRVGLTFATSIPAAVISMAILRRVAGSSILENNIVQTVASAAGTLAAIIFVLPGLVIIGWWSGFPFWTTFLVCALGGTLGVMFSVPLRRALVVDSPLPYPEGVAAAEVLRVGEDSRNGGAESAVGMAQIVRGALASAGFYLLIQMRFAVAEAAAFFPVGAGASGVAGGLSFALLGAGHLVGLSVGIAMLAGLVIAWGIAVPWLTAAAPQAGDIADWATTVWATKVRFIGAGVIAVAAIWTLLSIIGPIVRGISSAFAASRVRSAGAVMPLQERDIPVGIIGAVIIGSLLPIGWLLWSFIADGPLADDALPLILGTLGFILVAGLIIAAVCGYMAGLIGASNSPISGVGILAILAAALLLAAGFSGRDTAALTAYALFATAIVFGIATISNDNLQDLKTGQLVGATPWKQQVALVVGVLFGSMVIPPVLALLVEAYGFAGAPGAGPSALPAPQATLISSLAKGVLGGDLQWDLLGIGAVIGIAVVAIDLALARSGRMRLPPLGVGIGIYLPMATTLAVVVGAVVGHVYDRLVSSHAADPERGRRMGVLLATGLIVGESLMGVIFAGAVVVSGSDSVIAVAPAAWAPFALPLGTAGFVALAAWLYRRAGAAALAPNESLTR